MQENNVESFSILQDIIVGGAGVGLCIDVVKVPVNAEGSIIGTLLIMDTNGGDLEITRYIACRLEL